MHLTQRFLVTSVLAMTGSASMAAIEPLPESDGWSGFGIFGLGYMDVESNLIVGNDLIDIGTDPVQSVNDSPRSEDDFLPFVTGEVRYTWAEPRTQVFLGSSILDIATLDFAQQLGVRKETKDLGTFQAGLLFSGLPAEVWEDPYVEGINRNETDRDSTGFRLQWDRIGGSNFELQVTMRDIDIDVERSGEFLGLTGAERQLLERDGDQIRMAVNYKFLNGPHLLQPELGYLDNDRDGGAMASDGLFGELTYAYLGRPVAFVASAVFGQKDYDAPNPVYGRRLDSDYFAFTGTLLYSLPTASNRWQAVGVLTYADEDSDVDFHDTRVLAINLGVRFVFGKRPGRRSGVE